MRIMLRSFLVLFFFVILLHSQSLIDGYNRSDNTTVGNNWSETETAASGAEINTNRLQLNSNNVSGREWVYQDVSAQYETILTNNAQVLTWAVSMRQSNPNPNGFNDGKYGILYVLGASSSDMGTANGYAVSIGKDGGTFPVSLFSFTNGFDSESKLTTVISGGNYKTEYVSIRVTYNPSSDTWSLFAEGNPTTFTDPLSASTQMGSSTVDATHTGLDLIYLGSFYNHGAAASDNALFDNTYIPGAASPSTQVQFASSSAFVNEGAGSYSIQVSVSDPDASVATLADIVLVGGTATNGNDITSYSTQSINFPAASSANQTVVITLTDDSDLEGTESLQFEVQNVSGGNNAYAGVPGEFTLNISDNDIALLMISEVADPSDNSNYRFVELFNNSGSTIDFSTQTWYLSRQNNGSAAQWDDINLTGTVNAGSVFSVAFSQADFLTAFGSSPDQSDANIAGDGRDGYFLYYNGDHSSGTLIDSYGNIDEDGDSQLWDYTSGHGYRNGDIAGPNPSWTYNEWTIVKPVASTGMDPADSPLPIELNFFVAVGGDKEVVLRWTTTSEIDNQGFAILRAEVKDGDYEEIDSYEGNSDLKGAGTSSSQNDYKYVDESVFNGNTYWYKLVDIDLSGVRTEHGPIYATPHSEEVKEVKSLLPGDFALYQNKPNPFNPSTTIKFDVPELREGAIEISITVFNLLGQKIATLYSGVVDARTYEAKWNGLNESGKRVPSGVYIYRLVSEHYSQSKRMTLVK